MPRQAGKPYYQADVAKPSTNRLQGLASTPWWCLSPERNARLSKKQPARQQDCHAEENEVSGNMHGNLHERLTLELSGHINREAIDWSA
jgi:hypothetical protein